MTPSRFAELLGSEKVVLVTEHDVEFDISAMTVKQLVDLSFDLALVDAIPETPEP